jgi:hypothetical protein
MAKAVAAYVVGLALFALFVAVPFLDKKRDIPAEVPSPPALSEVDLLNVKPGQRLCMSDIGVSKESRGMRFTVGTYGKPGPALRVSFDGRLSGVRAGYADNSTLSVAIPPPPHSELTSVCITNAGRTRVALYGAADRARSRVTTTIDGSAQPATVALSFSEAKPVSFLGQAGVIAGRIAVFRGFVDHAWIVWLLAIAMVFGVPVLIGVALGASARQLRSDSSGE